MVAQPITQTLDRILTINDPEDEAFLRLRAEEVQPGDLDLATLAFEMHALMPEHGLALAAPQVGLPFRVIYFAVPGRYLGGTRRDFRGIFANPRITRTTGKVDIEDEGCLSIPDWYGPVARDRRITVKMETPRGEQMTFSCEGKLARIIQHEMDHLDGILFTDRLAGPPKQIDARGQVVAVA